ncbi:hypothetical protein ACWKWP_04645 [Agromyces soli]
MSEVERDGMITLPEGLFGDAARANEPGGAAAEGLIDESVEATILVDRGDEAVAEETIVVDRSAPLPEEVEATVVVDRSGEFDGAADVLDGGAEAVEATVVVERTGERGPFAGQGAAPADGSQAAYPVDEATVVVERTGERGPFAGHGAAPAGGAEAAYPVDEATVVVERTGERSGPNADAGDEPADDAVTVVRQSSSRPAKTHPAASVMHAPTRRSRRSPAPAPVSDEVLRTAEHGPGAGVLDAYPSRAAEPLRIPIPDLGEGPAPTRDVQHALPSVSWRSRRTAVIGLAAVGAAAVVGLVGFVAVCANVIGGLLG